MFGSQETRMSDVRDDLAAVRNDLARLADTVSNMVAGRGGVARNARGAVDQARDKVYARANDLGKAGGMLADEARDRLNRANRQIENRIEHNPIRAVLIAAGVGLVLGLMSRSR
ncbi:hypothetical protein GCM10007036_35040 [Alsobacter metallidurans]|uniref:DUF883 domain-containing protein n=2 Tax=Alsobacter metallidurans TaxID=340221 RepID=A0A917I991_9HYPH|nr:hypothetical protein GCM10007036_35040 [Alsobacter metallidurans]